MNNLLKMFFILIVLFANFAEARVRLPYDDEATIEIARERGFTFRLPASEDITIHARSLSDK